MNLKNYRSNSEFILRYYSVGEARGLAEGKAEGRAEATANAVLKVLRARHRRAPRQDAARVRATTDLAQLEAWPVRAVELSRIADLWS